VLALSDVDAERVEQTADALPRRTAPGRSPWQVDVADRDAVFAHAQDVAEASRRGAPGRQQRRGRPARAGARARARRHALADGDQLLGVVHGSQAFLPHLVRSGDGQLANLSSVFGLVAVPQQAAYNAAKFAVRGFTEALQQEMRLEGCRWRSAACTPAASARDRTARRVSPSTTRASSTRAVRRLARIIFISSMLSCIFYVLLLICFV
jgi:NAD(P)-dependent dehydrogenase (short-subunit alcohol dehydrogenase family)